MMSVYVIFLFGMLASSLNPLFYYSGPSFEEVGRDWVEKTTVLFGAILILGILFLVRIFGRTSVRFDGMRPYPLLILTSLFLSDVIFLTFYLIRKGQNLMVENAIAGRLRIAEAVIVSGITLIFFLYAVGRVIFELREWKKSEK